MNDKPKSKNAGPLTIERNAKTLRQLALEKMREAILRFRFQPGDRLVERELCRQLGVSRSVVREVLRHLEAEGLVESIPHHGPAVARLDPAKVEQIYEIRAILEALAASTCAQQADNRVAAGLARAIDDINEAFKVDDPPAILEKTTDFYQKLFTWSGKTVAWETVCALNARINYLRALTISSPERHQNAIAEMWSIQEAIANQDADAAAEAARDHIQIVAAIAREYLEKTDEPSFTGVKKQ